LTVLAIALIASSTVYAEEVEHEMFNQICALLELDDSEKQKLAVAFITLEEDLYAATTGVGDENVDAAKVLDDFNATRSAFRDSVSTFLTPDKLETMLNYSSAIFYELADDIARVHVKTFKKSLGLTDDQITALTLVINEDLRSVVETCLIYNEGEVDNSVADSMKRELQGIRENTRAQVKKILTDDQWTKLQKMRG